MSYLISQLWICLFVASLLGGLVGWFLRGDNRSKLTEIENRWRSRFAELEFSNQALNNRLKQGDTSENKYKSLQSRLMKMNKAADLASQQLKFKDQSLSKIGQELEQSNIKLLDKKSQINELVTQLSNFETQQESGDKITNQLLSKKQVNQHKKLKKDYSPEMETLARQLQKKTDQYSAIKEKYEKISKKIDGYKASLMDAESKLEVAAKMLEDQSVNKK